jgi:hypothetical protein
MNVILRVNNALAVKATEELKASEPILFYLLKNIQTRKNGIKCEIAFLRLEWKKLFSMVDFNKLFSPY